MPSCEFNAKLIGIGDFVVASATAGHQTPENSNVIDGKIYTYYAQSFDTAVPPNVTAWEAGSGSYTILTHTLHRTTITANSDGTLIPINFSTPPVVDIMASPAQSLEPAIVPRPVVTLAVNGQLGFEATSNTILTIRYRGSDGVTRSVTLTLA